MIPSPRIGAIDGNPTRPQRACLSDGASMRRGAEADGTVMAWTFIFIAIAGASAFFAAADPVGTAAPATILAWVFAVLAAGSVLPRLLRGLAAPRSRPDGRRADG